MANEVKLVGGPFDGMTYPAGKATALRAYSCESAWPDNVVSLWGEPPPQQLVVHYYHQSKTDPAVFDYVRSVVDEDDERP